MASRSVICRSRRRRVKYWLDWTIFWIIFGPFFLPFFGPFFRPFYNGASTLLVLREGWVQSISTKGGWEVECYYSGRVEGGCNCKHYWLMELLLDRANQFNRFFDWLFVYQNFCAGPPRFLNFFCHAKAKLSGEHRIFICIENIEFTILHSWVASLA